MAQLAVTPYNGRMTEHELTNYLEQRLAERQPRRIPQPDLAEAGVLVAITAEASPKLLLTLRASHLSSHQGEVAFPGGKRDPEDHDIIHTALREAQEEVGLEPHQVQVLGVMDQVVSRFGYLVTPVLGIIRPGLDHIASPDELDAVFEVPLDLFRQSPSKYFERGNIRIPSYDYDDFHIWGLTAMMIAEMMNNLWDCDISLKY
jgi:8-oxo-dGTP pyrophosphatase MutT (NUDIX family)